MSDRVQNRSADSYAHPETRARYSAFGTQVTVTVGLWLSDPGRFPVHSPVEPREPPKRSDRPFSVD